MDPGGTLRRAAPCEREDVGRSCAVRDARGMESPRPGILTGSGPGSNRARPGHEAGQSGTEPQARESPARGRAGPARCHSQTRRLEAAATGAASAGQVRRIRRKGARLSPRALRTLELEEGSALLGVLAAVLAAVFLAAVLAALLAAVMAA